VNVVLEKKSTMLELVFKHEGTVNALWFNEWRFWFANTREMKLLVRFGHI
jgi:hypothetical protein